MAFFSPAFAANYDIETSKTYSEIKDDANLASADKIRVRKYGVGKLNIETNDNASFSINIANLGGTITNAGILTSGGDFTNTAGTFNNNNTATFSKAFKNASIYNNNANSTATFNGSAEFTHDSTTINSGTMIFNNGAKTGEIGYWQFVNSGDMSFNGADKNYDFHIIQNKDGGTITNAGTLTVTKDFTNYSGTLTNTGTLTSNGIFENRAGATITNSGTFNVASGKMLENNGTLENSGTFTGVLDSSGSVKNSGTLNANAGSKFAEVKNQANGVINATGSTFNFGRLFNNEGVVNVKASETETSFKGSELDNRGTFNVEKGATLTIQGSETDTYPSFYNIGTFNNAGTASVKAEFRNDEGAKFENSGDITFDSAVLNYQNSTFTNSGKLTISNEKKYLLLANGGVIKNEQGGEFLVDGYYMVDTYEKMSGGSFENAGKVTFTRGFYNNHKDSTFTNDGEAIFNGAFLNGSKDGGVAATFTNNKDGVVTIDGTASNTAGATITNAGTFSGAVTNSGTLTNSGTFTGEITNSGTATILGGSVQMLTNDGENAKASISDGVVTTLNNTKGTAEISGGEVGTLENAGTATISGGEVGTLKNLENAKASISGAVKLTTTTNAGAFEVTEAGVLTNSGEFTNSGTLTNAGTLINLGTLKSDETKKLENSGIIENSSTIAGALTNSGIINANAGSEFSGKITTAENSTINIKGATKFTDTANAFENVANAKFNVESGGSAEFSKAVTNAGEMSIKGTTLTTGETFTNSGTLNLSTANSTLGKVVATTSFTNEESGKVEVDTTGLKLNEEYTFIDSSDITGLENKVTIKGSDKYEYTQGEGKLRLSGFENLGTDTNHNSIQNAIEQAVVSSGGQMSKEHARQAISDTESHIKESVIAHPKAMLSAIKTNTINTPLQAAYVARLTASSEDIMSDAGAFVNPLQRTTETQFFLTPFGGALNGSGVSGSVLGFSLGVTHIGEDYIAQGHFSYANGDSTQDLATQSTDTKGNLFQAGAFMRLFFLEKLETDISLGFLLGAFELNNTWKNSTLEDSSANFNNYQGNLGVNVGWRFGENLSFKPYLGLQAYYEKQDKFHFDNLQLFSDEYSASLIDGLVGVEGRYVFENGGFIFAMATFQNKFHNSHNEVFMRIADTELSYENERYDNIIGANIGARVLSTQHFKLDLEGIYKHYNTGLNYYGGSLSLRFAF